MKTKLWLLLFAGVLLTGIASAQTKSKIESDVLSASVKGGIGKIIPLHFPMDATLRSKVKASSTYLETISEVEWLNNNLPKYNNDTLLLFLSNQVSFAGEMTKLSLKNGTSFSAPDDAEGMIYVNDKNVLIVSFPITGQNGYGNTVIKKTIFNGKTAYIVD